MSQSVWPSEDNKDGYYSIEDGGDFWKEWEMNDERAVKTSRGGDDRKNSCLGKMNQAAADGCARMTFFFFFGGGGVTFYVK